MLLKPKLHKNQSDFCFFTLSVIEAENAEFQHNKNKNINLDIKMSYKHKQIFNYKTKISPLKAQVNNLMQ